MENIRRCDACVCVEGGCYSLKNEEKNEAFFLLLKTFLFLLRLPFAATQLPAAHTRILRSLALLFGSHICGCCCMCVCLFFFSLIPPIKLKRITERPTASRRLKMKRKSFSLSVFLSLFRYFLMEFIYIYMFMLLWKTYKNSSRYTMLIRVHNNDFDDDVGRNIKICCACID